VLEHPSREAAKKAWADFQADPEWQKVSTESQVNGRIVSKVVSVFGRSDGLLADEVGDEQKALPLGARTCIRITRGTGITGKRGAESSRRSPGDDERRSVISVDRVPARALRGEAVAFERTV